MYNKEINLITLLPTYNSTISPLPINSLFALSFKPVIFFLVYTPTIQFVFLLFAFPFASWVVSFFFDVGVMGVTSRCLASRDNLIIWVLCERLFSVQWLLASFKKKKKNNVPFYKYLFYISVIY